MSRNGWYGRTCVEPTGTAQVDTLLQPSPGRTRRSAVRISEHVLRLAQAEYEHQYGHQQDYERMQERAGLSVMEVVGLLADYVERLGGKPTLPRSVAEQEQTQ